MYQAMCHFLIADGECIFNKGIFRRRMFLLAEKHLILQEFISQIPVQMLNLNNDLSYVFSESRGHFAILLQQKDI